MRKRVVSFLLSFLIVLSLCDIRVSATGSTGADFKAALQTFLGSAPSDTMVYNWSYIISSLKADGMTNNAIAGICGNVLHESSGGTYVVEGMYVQSAIKACGKHYMYFQSGETWDYGRDYYPPKTYTNTAHTTGSSGNGHGIVQWSYGRAETLTQFCDSLPSGIGYVTVKHNEWVDVANDRYEYKTRKIPDLPGQVLFMMQELHSSYSKVRADMQAASTPEDACEIFRARYEVGGGSSKESRKQAARRALSMIEICTGTVGEAPAQNPGGGNGQTEGGSGTLEGVQSVGAYMVSMGYWSEAQLVSYCALTEANLEETLLQAADSSNLGQKDLEGLTDWERNHAGNLKEHGYIAILRQAVVLVGILMTIWALLVYLAFWFDHINSFFYMDMLHILTFGQLHICSPGDKPTFSLKEKVKVRTVSHAQIIGICLTAILFGTLLISGVFYTFVNRLVNTILRWLK